MAKAHAERMAALERRSKPSNPNVAATPTRPPKLPGSVSFPAPDTPKRTSFRSDSFTARNFKRGDSGLTDSGLGKENNATNKDQPSKGDLAALGMTAVHLGMHDEGLSILREAECWHELISVLQVLCTHTQSHVCEGSIA